MVEKVDNNIALEKQKLKKACNEFEAIFIKYMLRTMRKSIPEAGLFKKESAEKIYTSLFDQKVAEKIAESKGIGIAEMVYKELSKLISERTEEKKIR